MTYISKDKNEDGPEHLPVPPSGSLGLLAYGYKGLLAWRKARREAKDPESTINSDGNKS
jgi:hypothetical protein